MKKLITILMAIFIVNLYSCDECRNALNEREVQGFKVVFKDQNTNQNLFFGDGKRYETTDLQLFYIGSMDTLIKRSDYNYYTDNEGFVIDTKKNSGDDITTFYIQTKYTNPLDTIDIVFNEVEHKCFGTFRESYNLYLNGQIACENCNNEDFITIYE